MRLAVISDIHGNCTALDTVLADMDARGIDSLACLGDCIQGGHQPAETVARLSSLDCPVVMGNSDAWLLSGEHSGAEATSESQEAMRAWSLAQLSPADREYIAGFTPTIRVPLTRHLDFFGFHGTPASYDELIFPETPHSEVMLALGEYLPAVMAGGHTHTPQVRRFGTSFFFNPGSVGVVYDRHAPAPGDPFDAWAEYAILDVADDTVGLELRRVPVEAGRVHREILETDAPNLEVFSRRYRPVDGKGA